MSATIPDTVRIQSAPDLTREQAEDIERREAAHQSWIGERTSYHPSEVPAGCEGPTNEERSALEVYRFKNDPPDRYVAYVSLPADRARDEAYARGRMTTWTGDDLGACYLGGTVRDNFGGKRYPIRVEGINGRKYHGWYYASSGNYCRVKACKAR